MSDNERQSRKDKSLRLLVTDSGIGGLSVCSEIERNLRQTAKYRHVHITYFNTWAQQHRDYNDLPELQSRADAFNRALVRMGQSKPDQIIIACNTLSVLYNHTEFSRTAVIPVLGIIDVGVDLFCEALSSDPLSSIVILGTPTTIESQAHRDKLMQKGIRGERIITVACHGLAAAIEKDPDSSATADLIERYGSQVCKAGLSGMRVYVGLCCTHYTYVRDSIRSSFERQSGREVELMDPNHRLADCVAPLEENARLAAAGSSVTVEVISTVEMDYKQRRAIVKRLESVSDITARALMSYSFRPDLL